VEKYMAVARRYGLDPAQMALAFVNSRPFLTATIVGATNLAQLQSNIASIGVKLSSEILAEIEAVNREYTYPCP
jgi:aryl-alcohol dehydrogenase-like predicted oxidoreductase